MTPYGSPVKLSDGTTGFHMTRADDCLRPAIATVLGIDVRNVPDPQLDRRLAAGEHPDVIALRSLRVLVRWLGRRGLRLVVHGKVPVDSPRWIGVVIPPGRLPFAAHCMVMHFDRVIHDPMWSPQSEYALKAVVGKQVAAQVRVQFKPSQVTYGLVFERRDKHVRW